MKTYEPVVIDRESGGYRVHQGGELLLVVPEPLFETYAQDAVFPPLWRPLQSEQTVRRLHWHPVSRQFLMAGVESSTPRTVEGFGTTGYRSFLHGFWLPAPPTLLLRPYWNPADPHAAFGPAERNRSLEVQLAFYRILNQLRPPSEWTTVLNATEGYLEAIGLTAPGGIPDEEAPQELALFPPLDLSTEPGRELLLHVSQHQVKQVFPLIREQALCGFQVLGLAARHGLEAALEQRQIGYQLGSPHPH